MDLLEKAIEDILLSRQKIDKAPAGFIMSENNLTELKRQAIYAKREPHDEIPKMYGVPVYAFSDVPDKDLIAVRDQKKLNKYLLRRKKGYSHNDSLLELFENIGYSSPDFDFLNP